MRTVLSTLFFSTLIFSLPLTLSQAATPGLASKESLAGLVYAIRFADNYKEVAAASAEVFAARAQGSDLELSEIMRRVSVADLSGAKPCLINVYAQQAFTDDQAKQLRAFFSSDLGVKLLSESQKAQIASYRSLSPQPINTGVFDAREQQALAAIYQTDAFKKYAQMSTNPTVAAAMVQCIYSAAGIELP